MVWHTRRQRFQKCWSTRQTWAQPQPYHAAQAENGRVPATRPAPASQDPAKTVASELQKFDQARDNTILPKLGTSTYSIDHEAIEALPRARMPRLDKCCCRPRECIKNSAASGEGPFHIRNEHGNVQYRINGIMLPSGVSGFVNILETGFVGNLDLVTGALPAPVRFPHRGSGGYYEPHRWLTEPAGRVSIYGGSRQTITPSFEYGGILGDAGPSSRVDISQPLRGSKIPRSTSTLLATTWRGKATRLRLDRA